MDWTWPIHVKVQFQTSVNMILALCVQLKQRISWLDQHQFFKQYPVPELVKYNFTTTWLLSQFRDSASTNVHAKLFLYFILWPFLSN
jgi:hypothetical protein